MKTVFKIFKTISIAVVLASLAACGGGGGGGGASTPTQSSDWGGMTWDNDNWG